MVSGRILLFALAASAVLGMLVMTSTTDAYERAYGFVVGYTTHLAARSSRKEFDGEIGYQDLGGGAFAKTAHLSHKDYVALQTQGNKNKLYWQGVQNEEIGALADWLTKHVHFMNHVGICHGVRQGHEQRWFQERLGWKPGSIIGTDISDTATWFPNTIQQDFHEVKPEWLSRVDFIYSNALDHSYDPQKALRSWKSCLSADGVILLQHAPQHGKDYLSLQWGDLFGTDLEGYRQLALSVGLHVVTELPIKPSDSDALVTYLVLAQTRFRDKADNL